MCQRGASGFCTDVSTLRKSNARRGRKTYAAFLDVRKAYPTVRRAAMLERLYGKLGDGQSRCRVWTVIERMLREENCLSRVVVHACHVVG